jgi:outer membrane protein assembly factor BamB
MATLEVHDDRGGVVYVAIASGSTALIGRDAKCDVVLESPDVLPIHARLRWKRGRLKVEATPEARAIDLNGRRVIASKLRQGDELRIASHRIFVLSAEENAPDGEVTRVQPRPPAASRLERGDWLKDLEVAPPEPTVERPEDDDARGRPSLAWVRMAAKSSAVVDVARSPAEASEQPARGRLWRGVADAVLGRDRAPDDERIATSPLVIGLVVSLAVLALLSAGLWNVIARRTADNRYFAAMEAYGEADYPSAVRRFERFATSHPKDPRADRATVLGSLSRVRQLAAGAAPAWSEALAAARAMPGAHAASPAFADLRADLAQTVLAIADGLADRARAAADPRALSEAESAVGLHDSLAGNAAPAIRARTRLPGRLQEARRVVLRGQVRAAAIAAMDRALAARDAAATYEARDALVAEYPDLAGDAGVVDRLRKANALLQRAATVDPSASPADREARPDPLGPATVLAVRGALAADPAPREFVYALADDQACGLSAATGAPLWAVTVGHASPFAPRPVAGATPGVLVIDARHDDLLRLDARTGAIAWRQPLGERATAPPLLLGDDLFQPTAGGRLLRIDVETGERRGAVDLRQPIAHSPVADELGRTLYLMGERSNLFLVDRESLACVGVEYIGHDARSVAATPARLGRYLILPINAGLTAGHWQVWLLAEDGRALKPLQRLDLAGWTWQTPAVLGSVLWAASDRGDLSAYAIGAETEREPFRAIAKTTAQTTTLGPTFLLPRTERDVLVASRQPSRYALEAERGRIVAGWSLVECGPALAPPQRAGALAVFTQQDAAGPGVTLWALDVESGRVAWRTTLGPRWPLPPGAQADAGVLSSAGPDGRPLAIGLDRLRAGGFVAAPVPAANVAGLPEGPAAASVSGSRGILFDPGRPDRLVVLDGAGPPREVVLPTAAVAAPRAWADLLAVPAEDGLVDVIDPRTGASVADPYVPPFDRDRPHRWRTPAVVDDGRLVVLDASGRLRALVRRDGPRPRLEAVGEVRDLGRAPVADPVATPRAVVVATDDRQVRALAVRDLSPLGAWALPAPPAMGPVVVGDRIVVADRTGHLLALDLDGRRAWEADLGRVPVGPPARRGDRLWFLDDAGTLVGVDAAAGAIAARLPLGILPAGGPIAAGDGLAVPTGPGTLRFLPAEALETAADPAPAEGARP